jgi:Tfp pilus assembly protein PilF
MAEWHLMKGDEGAAADAIASLQPSPQAPDIHDHHVPYHHPHLAWAQLEQGDVVAAAQLVDHGVRHAQQRNAALALLDATRIHAMVHTRQGHWEEARNGLDDAIALARRIGDPYAEARALFAYGELFLSQGETDEARRRLEQALTVFRQLGARPYIERTEHLLANLNPD